MKPSTGTRIYGIAIILAVIVTFILVTSAVFAAVQSVLKYVPTTGREGISRDVLKQLLIEILRSTVVGMLQANAITCTLIGIAGAILALSLKPLLPITLCRILAVILFILAIAGCVWGFYVSTLPQIEKTIVEFVNEIVKTLPEKVEPERVAMYVSSVISEESIASMFHRIAVLVSATAITMSIIYILSALPLTSISYRYRDKLILFCSIVIVLNGVFGVIDSLLLIGGAIEARLVIDRISSALGILTLIVAIILVIVAGKLNKFIEQRREETSTQTTATP